MKTDFYDKLIEEKGFSNLVEEIRRKSLASYPRKKFWTVNNIVYRNGIYRVDLLKDFLDNGDAKTQDEWAEYSRKEKQKNGFYVGDFPLYHSLFSSIHKIKDDAKKEEVRVFLERKFREKWLTTLTRIKYSSFGEIDEIVHNYNMSEEYSFFDYFLGQSGLIKNLENRINFMVLLGTNDLQEINSIYKWITGRDTHLFRKDSMKTLNKKISKKIPSHLNYNERVTRIGFYSGLANLDFDGGKFGKNPALGIRAIPTTTVPVLYSYS
ncbi:MAG: hypothetical protein Q8P15_00815 [Nanoarchaeota archaeon]|nr:hypothetical protein [Nanoarchaeota archaeon]